MDDGVASIICQALPSTICASSSSTTCTRSAPFSPVSGSTAPTRVNLTPSLVVAAQVEFEQQLKGARHIIASSGKSQVLST